MFYLCCSVGLLLIGLCYVLLVWFGDIFVMYVLVLLLLLVCCEVLCSWLLWMGVIVYLGGVVLMLLVGVMVLMVLVEEVWGMFVEV